MTVYLFACLDILALDSGDIRGSGHIVYDRVKQLLYALVAVRSTAAYGNHLVGDSRLADSCLDLVDSELLTREILVHKLFGGLGDRLDELFVILLSKILHVLGDLDSLALLAVGTCIGLGSHLYEVDDTCEGILKADRELDRNGVALESVVHHLKNMVEISARDVHLVDVYHAGNLVVIRLTPNCLGLGLNTALSAKDGYRTVQDTQ